MAVKKYVSQANLNAFATALKTKLDGVYSTKAVVEALQQLVTSNHEAALKYADILTGEAAPSEAPKFAGQVYLQILADAEPVMYVAFGTTVDKWEKFYTGDAIDAKIQEIVSGDLTQALRDYAKTEYVNTELAKKADKAHTHSSDDVQVSTGDAGTETLTQTLTGIKGDVTTAKAQIEVNKGDITNLKGRADALEAKDTKIEGRVTVVEGKVSTIEDKLPTMESDISANKEGLATATADITNLKGKVAAVEKELPTVKADVAANTAKLEGITTTVKAELDKKAEKVHTHQASEVQVNLETTLDKKLAAMDKATEDITKVGGTIDTKIAANKAVVDGQINDLTTKVEENKTATAANTAKLEGITTTVKAELDKKAAKEHTHAVATTDTNGFMSSTDKTALDNHLTDVEMHVSSEQKANIAKIAGLDKTVNDPSTGLVKKVADLAAKDTEIEGKVTTLEGTVNDSTQGVVANYNAIKALQGLVAGKPHTMVVADKVEFEKLTLSELAVGTICYVINAAGINVTPRAIEEAGAKSFIVGEKDQTKEWLLLAEMVPTMSADAITSNPVETGISGANNVEAALKALQSNKLDKTATGVDKLGLIANLTSDAQAQINGKLDKDRTRDNANKVLIVGADGMVTEGAAVANELQYLTGLKANVKTTLDAKLNSADLVELSEEDINAAINAAFGA